MDIQEVRAKFPQYADMPDGQLADALHAKFYSDIPKDKFYSTIGYQVEKPKTDWLRATALGARAAGEGVLSAPLTFIDVMQGGGIKRALFKDAPPSLQDQIKEKLNESGAYNPETPNERVGSDIVSGAVSALGGGGKGISAAVMALLSGGTASGLSSSVKESGGGTGAQIASGLLGGLTPAAIKGASGFAANKIGDVGATVGASFNNQRAIKRLAEDAARRTSGTDRDFIAAAEKGATNYIGAPVTTAEAIAQRNQMTPDVRAGSTVALQQNLTGAQGATAVLPSVSKIQNAAMESTLQKLAGGADRTTQDASQGIAKQFRADNAGKQYEALASTKVGMTPELATLLASPAGSTAYAMAKKISDNANAAKSAAGLPIVPFQFTNQTGKVTGFTAQGLQDVKSALDEAATSPTLQSSLGITGRSTNKVADVRGGLIDFMNGAIPGWKNARQAYSAQSEPLNQLQVGQALLDKFKNERGTPTAGTFLNAMGRGEDALLKRSTGSPRDVSFPAGDQQSLDNIVSQLLRSESVKKIGGEIKGAGGSGLASSEIPQLPNLLSRTAMIANYGLKFVGKTANDPVANYVAKKMATGTYSDLLKRPMGDPMRTAAEAMIQAALGTNAAQ